MTCGAQGQSHLPERQDFVFVAILPYRQMSYFALLPQTALRLSAVMKIWLFKPFLIHYFITFSVCPLSYIIIYIPLVGS